MGKRVYQKRKTHYIFMGVSKLDAHHAELPVPAGTIVSRKDMKLLHQWPDGLYSGIWKGRKFFEMIIEEK